MNREYFRIVSHDSHWGASTVYTCALVLFHSRCPCRHAQYEHQSSKTAGNLRRPARPGFQYRERAESSQQRVKSGSATQFPGIGTVCGSLQWPRQAVHMSFRDIGRQRRHERNEVSTTILLMGEKCWEQMLNASLRTTMLRDSSEVLQQALPSTNRQQREVRAQMQRTSLLTRSSELQTYGASGKGSILSIQTQLHYYLMVCSDFKRGKAD